MGGSQAERTSVEEAITDDPLCVASALLISIDQVGDICFGDIISIPSIGDYIHSNRILKRFHKHFYSSL